MDSFYDAPRKSPAPMAAQRIVPTTMVPDVSLLCQDNSKPYASWKNTNQQYMNHPISNKENFNVFQRQQQVNFKSPQSSSILKKQVRFVSPNQGQRPLASYEPVFPKDSNNFEHMYMANVPNRHLDLSMLEPSFQNKQQVIENRKEKPEEVMPTTYKQFMENQKHAVDKCAIPVGNHRVPHDDNGVTDIFNYLKNKNMASNDSLVVNDRTSKTPEKNNEFLPVLQENLRQPIKQDVVTQTSAVYNQEKPQDNQQSDEPTVKDLLKIISQQNEQLLLLQKQVASLIDRDKVQKQQEILPPQASAPYVTSTQHEKIDSPRKRVMPKFSIDLMTSFEVSFRRQNKPKEFFNYEPRIQEITETESTVTNNIDRRGAVDSSIHFGEPLKVRESCPSPDPTIQINDFEDYDSSSDETNSEIGITFYKNLMGQVNNILKKAQIQPKAEMTGGFKQKTLNVVKETTLKHLKNIGVTVPRNVEDLENTSGSTEDSKEYNLNDISFAVKQLLMKYLPNDHLAKVALKTNEKVPAKVPCNPGFISRPDMSFASLQYMKKYNLLTPANGCAEKSRPYVKMTKGQNETPKILDISTLKQQPKLL